MMNARASNPAFALLLAVGVLACGPASEPPVRPEGDVHVVLYLVDTLRRDRLGFHGYDRPTSPVLDELAARSVVFDEAYAPAPWTVPSVVSLMTSTSPMDHQVLLWGQTIGPGLVPLPRRLAEMGFETAAFVGNEAAGPVVGLDDEYDHYEPISQVRPAKPVARWLEKTGPGPKFLYVHTAEPHRPFRAPKEMVRRFGKPKLGEVAPINALTLAYLEMLRVDAKNSRAPGTTDNTGRQQKVLGLLAQRRETLDDFYDGAVAWADDRAGELIDVLKRRGMWEQTVFVLVSDHGEELLEHEALLHGQSLYAELVRIPMLWRFPGDQAGGRRVARPVTLLDVMPTLLDFLGHPAPFEGALGDSLLPRIRGGAAPDGPVVTSVRMNRNLYSRPIKEARGDFNIAVAEGRWRGIWNVETEGFELYNVEADPGEQRDRAAQEPEVAARLRVEAERWLADRPRIEGAEPEGTPGNLDHLSPETLEHLRMLGYID